ncbi:MAG: hypothetical protein JW808_03655 [Victivallales bacterium]|nr:hypothetical protein [Victivallales bacterium]
MLCEPGFNSELVLKTGACSENTTNYLRLAAEVEFSRWSCGLSIKDKIASPSTVREKSLCQVTENFRS